MSDAFGDFDARVRRIDLARVRLERGYVGKVRPDGLIVFTRRRRLPRVPLRGLLYIVLGLVFFKAAVLAHLGAVTYDARIERLDQGHVLEQAGAWIMQPDGVTRWMAAYLGPVLR